MTKITSEWENPIILTWSYCSDLEKFQGQVFHSCNSVSGWAIAMLRTKLLMLKENDIEICKFDLDKNQGQGHPGWYDPKWVGTDVS